jgi:hypothetical protein
MAKENPGWGYDWIVGAMANLGHRLSDQTVGNILPYGQKTHLTPLRAHSFQQIQFRSPTQIRM